MVQRSSIGMTRSMTGDWSKYCTTNDVAQSKGNTSESLATCK